MGKLLLLSVVFMSVVIGVITARSRRLWPGVWRLLGLVLASLAMQTLFDGLRPFLLSLR